MPVNLAIPLPNLALPGGSALPINSALTYESPKEGRAYIPVVIGWPGPMVAKSYEVNVQGLTTQPFSQVVMLDVDNSECGAPVTFLFPDSGDTLAIPPSSGGLFPVFTRSTKFYVAAPEALATDVTRFRILNYRQEPVALPPPQFTQIAAAINVSAAGTTAILGSSVNGTLTGWSCTISGFATSPGASGITASLVDKATGNILDSGSITMGQNQGVSSIVFNVSGAAVRFTGGLDCVVSSSGTVTSIDVNLFVRYRIP